MQHKVFSQSGLYDFHKNLDVFPGNRFPTQPHDLASTSQNLPDNSVIWMSLLDFPFA
jgi:hypothetical protein